MTTHPTGKEYKLLERKWRQRRARILQMVQRGTPKADVARMLGVSRQRVHQILKSEGV